MKVLHVIAGHIWGGIETSMVCFARTPGAIRHQFAMCFDGLLANELRASGSTVNVLSAPRLSRPWRVLRYRKLLEAALRVEKPDVVITHGEWLHAIAASAVRKASTAKMVLWLHGIPERGGWIARIAKRTLPDMLIANSHFTKTFAPTSYPGIPCEVVYEPVRMPGPPPDERAKIRARIRKELDTPDDDVAILIGCRMERWKGPSVLIDAFAKMRDAPGWVGWVAGGAQRPEEKALVEELHATAERERVAGRIRFLGHRTDVPQLLAASDILCQPNLEPEPFGVVFIEALAVGVPIVTSAAGGALEIVDASTGVLVPAGDSGAVARELLRLAGDRELRARLGAHGPGRAKLLCDPQSRVSDLFKVLTKLLATPSPAGGAAR